MPYRTSALTTGSDTAVACTRCATLTSLSLESSRGGRFTCRKCDLDQLVLREDLDVEALTLKNYAAVGSYAELVPFARELGKDVQTPGIDLECDGLACSIGLNINSGTVMGLDHTMQATGFPEMRFVTERPSHIDAKASGIVREVQTGDAAFDDEVYVESSAQDSDVLAVLSAPAARMAIRRLLRDTEQVTIGARTVSVFVSKNRDPYEPRGIRERIGWLRVIAGAPRPLVTEHVAVPRRARIPKMIVGWAFPLGLFLFILGLAKWTPNEAEGVLIGLATGFVLALAMVPIWTVLLRGRSTSHREILTWRIMTFVVAPLFVAGALLTYNGAFDDSKERAVRMTIRTVTADSDDSGMWHAGTVDGEGHSHSYWFRGQPKVGDVLQVGWRRGALGWTWESSVAFVVETAQP